MYTIYEVEEGDTILSVSDKVGVVPKEIRRINGFTMDYEVGAGEQIIVPVLTSYPFDKYMVVKGDTLYSISRRFNTTANQLAFLNGLDEDEYIYEGQELLVPKENTNFYVVLENETIADVAIKLNTTPVEIVRNNEKIYLLPDQVLILRNNQFYQL